MLKQNFLSVQKYKKYLTYTNKKTCFKALFAIFKTKSRPLVCFSLYWDLF